MKSFKYYQPTRITFGFGKLEEVGEIAKRYGRKCLLVTVSASSVPVLRDLFERTKDILRNEGVEVAHFDGVIPNPTTGSISEGAKMAKEFGTEMVLGLGGGSSMDTAKAIAVEATHQGTAWDYRIFGEKKVTDKVLPIIAVTTTSGTGSQVTAVSVLTNPKERFKSAIVDPFIFPKEAIVDPELMLTVPEHITASTGFDVLAHAFETYVHVNANPYTDILAKESIRIVVECLPKLLKDLSNSDLRAKMAWADTLAGLSIANCGTTLPHGIGMAIGGNAPWVMHGEALAAIYPEFLQYTYRNSVERFADIARIFRPDLSSEKDEILAQKLADFMVSFLKEIDMWFGLEDLKIKKQDIGKIAEDTFKLPDYSVNPRVPTKEDVLEILGKAYSRRA